jgi:hypothetical protein
LSKPSDSIAMANFDAILNLQEQGILGFQIENVSDSPIIQGSALPASAVEFSPVINQIKGAAQEYSPIVLMILAALTLYFVAKKS